MNPFAVMTSRQSQRVRDRTASSSAIAAAIALLLSSGCATSRSSDADIPRRAFDNACLERQYDRLQASPGEASFELRRRGELLLLRWPGDLAFQSGSADIAPQADATLATLTAALRECNDTVARIIGHTDGTGGNRANRLLSTRRAERVADALVTRGVDPSRLSTAGSGEERPIATNTSAAGRALNRRVEIEIRPAD